MLTTDEQKSQTLKLIASLERQLDAPGKPGVPPVLLKAQKGLTRESIAELRTEIAEYDAACAATQLAIKPNGNEELARRSIINLLIPLVNNVDHQMKHDALYSIVERLLPKGPVSPHLVHTVLGEARLRIDVLTGVDWLTISKIIELADSGADWNAQAHEWKAAGAIFSIIHAGDDYYPSYGLDKRLGYRPLAAMAKVLAIFGETKSGWGLAYWFWSPNSYLGCERPHNKLATHPDQVIVAAQAEFNGIQHS